MNNRGRESNKNIFRQMKKSDNPVTKSILREILIKRLEAWDYE